MESLNYLRSALEYISRHSRRDANLDMLKQSVLAPKFMLPKEGLVLDNDLRALPDKLRLPYPAIVVEYACNENHMESLAKAAAETNLNDLVLAAMTRGQYSRDGVVLIVTQEGAGPIEFTIISHITNQKQWVLSPFTGKFDPDRETVFKLLAGENIPFEGGDHEALPKAWMGRLVSDTSRGPIRALCELIEALSFSNITEVEVPAKKMTFTEQRKKALPYSSYNVLLVNKSENVVGAGRTEIGLCGERRQSREHTRRGHERTYKLTGKKIWINPMIVNAGVGARIIKDYAIKG